MSLIETWLNRTLGLLAALLLFFMMCLTFVDVMMRYVFNSPIGASFEVTELALGLVVFAGLPLVTMKEEHVSIDLIDLILPEKAIAAMRRIVFLLMAGCLGVLTWRLWLQADRFLSYGDTTATAMIPIAPFYYAMSVLTGFTTALLLAKTVLPRAPDDGEPHYEYSAQ